MKHTVMLAIIITVILNGIWNTWTVLYCCLVLIMILLLWKYYWINIYFTKQRYLLHIIPNVYSKWKVNRTDSWCEWALWDVCNYVWALWDVCNSLCEHFEMYATLCEHFEMYVTLYEHFEMYATLCMSTLRCMQLFVWALWDVCNSLCEHFEMYATLYEHMYATMYEHFEMYITLYEHWDVCNSSYEHFEMYVTV